MSNKKKVLIYSLITIAIVLLYMIIPVFLYPDSDTYYLTAKILLGLEEFYKWDIVRGPIMALVQYPFLKLFGTNEFSLRICTCAFYIIMLYGCSHLINDSIKSNNILKDNKFKIKLIYLFYIILIVLNPIIFGYYHGLLTEFVAFTLSVINIIIFNKIEKNGFYNNKKYILYLIYNSFIYVICWFLKQPYFTIAFFPTITLLYLNLRNKRNIIKTIIFNVVPVIFLLLSMNIWKNYTIEKGVDYENGRNNSHFLSNAIIDSNSNYEKQQDEELYTIAGIQNNNFLNKYEKDILIEKLNKNDKNYRIYYIHDLDGTIIDAEIFSYRNDTFSSLEALKFTTNAFIKHPIIVVDSYISNYLTSINVYNFTVNNNYYRPYKTFGNFNGENQTIGLVHLYNENNNFKWIESWHSSIQELEVEYSSNNIINLFVKLISYIHLQLFKILYLILPFLWIYLFIKTIKKDSKYNFIFIMISFVFLHTLFHTVTGAIIDRYIYITYPIYIIALINLYTVRYEGSIRKMTKEKNKKGKILFVIPAYNEEENIENVLKEIKKDVDYADILVINDCSTDKTKEIVEANKVKCITNIYNMKYAMAVQTGIKYAYENNYDYVIQFDADGQHIAKEAEKLYQTIIKEDCDIVIGSRYLEDTGYPCPKFRRIGTKLFEGIIRLFCDEKIADPLSGFQCLNKRVIKRYAEMGKYPEFPDANLVIEMLREGYIIKEVPVKMRLREAGVSMHGGIIKPIKYMINMFYTIVFILISTPRKKADK